ncbi:unnamed protein product [Thlaspi arvense]|uniref:G-box binding protein multifunctional mosaic region domain-containing protein n=1 Tax=Thlaspi arvense TaxID=13288 RepID=A0AAU9RVZ3_THLAR|nr:unnamed protein product [Thlaspi arvense]
MGDKPAKEAKTPTPQEQSSSTPSGTANPDWSSFQAYSPMPPHGFLASSPQAHPYMWGVQHIMPPYGTPPHPYVAMYPHGGIYAHHLCLRTVLLLTSYLLCLEATNLGSYPFSPFAVPSPNGVAEASVSYSNANGNTPGSVEPDSKLSEGKEKLPIKRSKGSLGSLNMITGKTSEPGKTCGASANGVYSKRVIKLYRNRVVDLTSRNRSQVREGNSIAESASEGSSEGSDADSQNFNSLWGLLDFEVGVWWTETRTDL